MNKYPELKNYNYANMYNNQNMANMPYQNINNDSSLYEDNKNKNLYDPYNGFIRGNLYKNLYDPYKLKTPYDIKPMNEQAELLTYIDALGFAMTDLNLYLDIYPDDKNMINLFNQYRTEKDNLLNEYENMYGPITLNSDSLNSYPWAWINMPWPWDN